MKKALVISGGGSKGAFAGGVAQYLMQNKNKKYALISVSDKSNVKELANFLTSNNFKIISTGGTYKKLKELKIEVVSISEITNFPEIMDGRVKTLHPIQHMYHIDLAIQEVQNYLHFLHQHLQY